MGLRLIQFARGLHYAHESEGHLIHQDVRSRLKFITASHIDDVLHIALDFTGVKPWKPEKQEKQPEQPLMGVPAPEPERPAERPLAN